MGDDGMSWTYRSSVVLGVLAGIGIVACGAPMAQAFTPPPPLEKTGAGSLLQRVSDSGVNIVRMPQRPQGPGKPAIPATQQTPTIQPSKPGATEAAQPQGRLLKMPVRLGSQPNDSQKGWLGVEMEPLELPMGLSLGLPNGDGAFLLNAVTSGPAAQAGIRFGDIVVGLNGRAVPSMNDLRQRVSAMTPGSEAQVEVWRVASDDGDFLGMLRKLAEGGNTHVMYRLGRLYGNGNGVARDEAEAVRWYRRASDAGNLSATAALAAAHIDGRGTAIDQQEGLRLLRLAAAKDHLDASNRLGHILLDGKITEKDQLEAARLFTKAAEAGHAQSMVDIGVMYANGVGVQSDIGKAAMWYNRAADLGHSGGMVNIGWLYEYGRGVEQDMSRAAMWYRRAADLNNAFGMMNLALMYANGKGVQRDDEASVALNRRAVSLGNAMAMNNLAWMLQSGRGVERREPEEAAELMMKALDRRNEFSRDRMTQHSSSWTREFRMALQAKLRDAGFYSGQIDGRFREPTVAAINAYFNRPR
jgi:TPR repeat protein